MKKLLFSICIAIVGFLGFSNVWYCDVMDDAFGQAENYQILTKKQHELSLGAEPGSKQSLIIKGSKLLIQIAVWLGIFVVLYWGIKFMISMWDETKMKENRDALLLSLLWLILVLSAYFILELMQSIWTEFVQ